MKNVIIAAGGTGGHINAALSLGETCEEKGYNVIYFSGKRHLDYKLFENQNVIHIDAKPLRTKNIIKLLFNIFMNIITFIKIFFEVIKIQPAFVIGCGGYVCGPVLLTSWLGFKKIFVVEQNAIAGLTNKLLAKIADINFLAFKNTKGISRNIVVSGNPIRSSIKHTNVENPKENINLLVFGGSLGATQVNKLIFNYAKSKPENINIRHQVGKGNIQKINLDGYEQLEYLDNIQDDYKWANIIISRAGASTISELAVVQKPSILIPYPNAVDNHQLFNANSLKESSKFEVIVLDHNKTDDLLYNDFKIALDEIISKKKFIPRDISKVIDAREVVIREIQKICTV